MNCFKSSMNCFYNNQCVILTGDSPSNFPGSKTDLHCMWLMTRKVQGSLQEPCSSQMAWMQNFTVCHALSEDLVPRKTLYFTVEHIVCQFMLVVWLFLRCGYIFYFTKNKKKTLFQMQLLMHIHTIGQFMKETLKFNMKVIDAITQLSNNSVMIV